LLSDTASNLTAYDIVLIIDFKPAYYLNILTRLGGAVCRDVCRQRPEMWVKVGYMKFLVGAGLNGGWQLVI
jgi:hypothetical protein